MKKTLFFTLFAFAAVGFMSCDEEENTLNEDSGIVGTWEGEDQHHKPIATIKGDGTYVWEWVGGDRFKALAQEGVVQVQFVELSLAGTVVIQVLTLLEPVYEQVIERTVRYELQCAERVGHTLKVVALAVCKVIHGVCFPLGSGAVMRSLYYAVNDSKWNPCLGSSVKRALFRSNLSGQ